jgi:hypothetical protein
VPIPRAPSFCEVKEPEELPELPEEPPEELAPDELLDAPELPPSPASSFESKPELLLLQAMGKPTAPSSATNVAASMNFFIVPLPRGQGIP